MTEQEWADHYKKIIAEKDAHIAELEYGISIRETVIKNMCDNERELREESKKVLSEHEVDGDTFGVPMIGEITKLLVQKIAELEKELEGYVKKEGGE